MLFRVTYTNGIQEHLAAPDKQMLIERLMLRHIPIARHVAKLAVRTAAGWRAVKVA